MRRVLVDRARRPPACALAFLTAHNARTAPAGVRGGLCAAFLTRAQRAAQVAACALAFLTRAYTGAERVRLYTRLFMSFTWRNDAELLELMRSKLFTAVVGDVLDALGYLHQFLPPRIRPLNPRMVVAGRAMPVLEADYYNAPD